ncbi:HAD family hydrolase [Hoeflea sp. WL0058]|uniref:HAD family hydrolase n=1 Tax=Flavimaribacter sediminis TaxID=2865987 RepID=A0AAE2ZGQ4_9HYPH|nr:HAD-IIB family hydrolase [Flavimaribacter sediminis]MBW8636273.1 HAD family hydrolase [Flavimaribacter sediminis]
MTREPYLVVSDIDDTLTGDAQALCDLADILAAHRDTVRFALNSSRPSASVDKTIETEFPPGFEADACITAMGTEIRVDGALIGDWEARFSDWPRDEIFRIVEAEGHPPHATEFQTRYKVSFAVPRGGPQDHVREILAKTGADCRFIASGADDFDIIPSLAGKDNAAIFLAGFLGISTERLIVAGDSQNDLAMFQVAFRAIAVGNARLELLDAMPVNTSYRATRNHAAGVIEGLRHFGVISA